MAITPLNGGLRGSAAPANTFDGQPDLIAQMDALSKKVGEMVTAFQNVEPSMEIILNLKDQFSNLESRTISIVNQFQDQIYLKEDEADQIILALNNEVDRIEKNIDDLLGLAQDFNSIAEEIKALLAIKDRVDVLEGLVAKLEGATKMVPIAVGKTIAVADRKSDSLYLNIAKEEGTGTNKIYRTTFEDHTGATHYFKSAADIITFAGAGTVLFGGLNNTDAVLKKIDGILSKKTYIQTFYAVATANYEGTEAPYTQTISVPGIKESDEPFAGYLTDLNNTELAIQQDKAAGLISNIVTSDNAITLYCNKKKPEVSVNIRLVVFRTD